MKEVCMDVKPPYPYYGGKRDLADWIISYFPPHDCYVEVFFGSGTVFFKKKPSDSEIINDLNSHVVNFFRVMRDPVKWKMLVDLLELTPYSREEHDFCCKNKDEDGIDDIEKARRYYVSITQSYNAEEDASWSYQINRNPALKIAYRLPGVVNLFRRLQHTQVENLSFEKIFQRYGNKENVLMYLDPPYLHTTRIAKKAYKHEMPEEQHILLLACCKNAKAKVILSGYDSDLYNETLPDWSKAMIETIAKAGSNGSPRTEVLWFNYEIKPSILDAISKN